MISRSYWKWVRYILSVFLLVSLLPSFTAEAAPELLSVVPDEKSGVAKFKPTGIQDMYVTAENSVAFKGQIKGADEIKLTVFKKGAGGQNLVTSDRRYNANFSSMDPALDNPQYFANFETTGHFKTHLIPLNLTGETMFMFSVTDNAGITATKLIIVTRGQESYTIVSPTISKSGSGQDQAYINSNFVEIEIETDNASSVMFGKEQAVKKEVTDHSGKLKTRFTYEVMNLKPGMNTIKYEVMIGSDNHKGELVLFNANTPIEGAQYKSSMKTSMKVFDGLVQLTFPNGTNFMRNEPSAVNQFLSSDRHILFAIANKDDGRVDKYKYPLASDGQLNNPNPLINPIGKSILAETTGRFSPASELIWMDAGTIAKTETDINKAIHGSGRLPYDPEAFYNRSLNDLVVPIHRGQLTLKYDPIKRADAWRYVTVFHFDIYEDHTGSTKPRWRNLGGSIDVVNNTITVPLERFGYYQVMYMNESFDDAYFGWAKDDLDTLYAKGIMLSNASAKSAVPTQPISRGEFATMLVRIFDIPLQYTDIPTFTDVRRTNPSTVLYDYKYIETAVNAGIIRGYGGGRFAPAHSISRQDAAVMIAKAANLKLNSNQSSVLQSLSVTFTDANSIAGYSRSAVEAITKTRLINGKANALQVGQTVSTNRFDPRGTLTRAEAATIAVNVLRSQKKIPN